MNKSKTPIAQQLKSLYQRKKLLQAKVANGELLKRREMEELRLSASELQKFKILSTCLVPVGNILIAPIYFNPRRFWPSMLWDYKNHIKYREQENMEKLVFQDQLAGMSSLQKILMQITKSLNSRSQLTALSQDKFSDTSPLSLPSLPRSHLEQLAACHNLCTFTFMYAWAPTSFLVQWLTARGRELAEDDRLLLAENDLEGLTTKEVIDACLRRGILTNGVYATLVLQTGSEEEDEDGGDGDEKVDTNEEDISRLMMQNWDLEVLRDRLRQWVSVASVIDTPTPQKNISFYVHATALGLFVQKC